MPSSMTAFARISKEYPWGTLSWELRTVNHRFLEPHFRLPENLRELETLLRGSLRGNLNRGKLDASLQLDLAGQNTDIVISQDRARAYVQACDALSAIISTAAPLSPLELLQLPGVIQATECDYEAIQREALALFNTAVDDLKKARQREGKVLGEIIVQRLATIGAEAKIVRARLPELLQAQKERLQQRLSDVVVDVDVGRLEQEMVYHAQRADVAEELDRLDVHLAEFELALAASGPIGRRLDFLCQELNREANTLSSKSLATDTTRAAVEMKVLIEQIREQVQNIE
ncbi:MAG: YicC family protein [Porticoccaceae bacterium]|nr:YicC family protein [Porticoccaceae bacterium]